MSARCTSCGAEIVFATTPAGKPMPLDAKQPRGLWFVWEEDGQVRTEPLKDDALGGVRISHFATCPNAAQHRKRG